MRFLFCALTFFVLIHDAIAETPSLRTQVVLATYRLEHPKTSGTAFVIHRFDPADQEQKEWLLVTAAHAFEKMNGDKATLVLRKRETDGEWAAAPFELKIRDGEKKLWHRHPKHDVAILRLPKSIPAETASLPLDVLADTEDWQAHPPDPGSFVRSVGFPHAAHFKPSSAGFPLTRLGCLASYPLKPFEKHPTFLVDYNVFEGDSGGPVYWEPPADGSTGLKIIGLVHGQHFLDEKYDLIYQKGQIRKRLGMAIITNSEAILETIKTLP